MISIPDGLSRLALWVLWQLSDRRRACGVEIGTPPDAEAATKLADAIRLITDVAPEDRRRMDRLVRRIIVLDVIENLGEWHEEAKTICVSLSHVQDPETDVGHLAATIVHEVTHAWLESWGFGYRVDRRNRIEAICFRREAAFAERLEGGRAFAVYCRQLAEKALKSEAYTDAAFAVDRHRALVRIGLPHWVARAFTGSGQPRAR